MGRGPAWSNSLFEDNAEFGLGMRVSFDKQAEYARELVERLSGQLGDELVADILAADQSTEAGIQEQRRRVAKLTERLAGSDLAAARDLLSVAGALVKKSVWINILVLDTEVYSNTGGQMSKSTPRGAVAKFAAGGKRSAKKDLAMMAMTYGRVYVARVAMGASDTQTLKAFLEAEAYDGPSLIIAYSPCIAHGYDLLHSLEQQKAAVQSAYWPLFRYNPELAAGGKNPFQLDSRAATIPLSKYVYNEGRYSMLARSAPETAALLLTEAGQDVSSRWKLYEQWAGLSNASQNGATK
jgi:pyruvate-ferredoxin/flavodoxin oxidoreductase